MKNTILVILLLNSLLSFAQKEYIPGYVMLNSGEKKSGFVLNSEEADSTPVAFKNSPFHAEVIYQLGTLNEYFLKPNRLFHFKTMKIDDSTSRGYYFEALVLGEVSLYKKDVDLFIETQEEGLILLQNTKKETMRSGKRYLSFANEYVDVLSNTLEVDPNFPINMNRVRLDEISLIELLSDYNRTRNNLQYIKKKDKNLKIDSGFGFSYGGGSSRLYDRQAGKDILSGLYNANNTLKVQSQIAINNPKFKKMLPIVLGLAYRYDRFSGTVIHQKQSNQYVTSLSSSIQYLEYSIGLRYIQPVANRILYFSGGIRMAKVLKTEVELLSEERIDNEVYFDLYNPEEFLADQGGFYLKAYTNNPFFLKDFTFLGFEFSYDSNTNNTFEESTFKSRNIRGYVFIDFRL